MKLKQDKLIKIVRMAFVVLIVVFMALSVYNSSTKEERKIIITNTESKCQGCPNKNQCNKNNSEASCNNVASQDTE